MGLSVKLYLQSGTSAYDQMHANNVMIMPCSDYLAKVKKSQKIMVGDCTIMYEKKASH